jgi:hypothetical protein
MELRADVENTVESCPPPPPAAGHGYLDDAAEGDVAAYAAIMSCGPCGSALSATTTLGPRSCRRRRASNRTPTKARIAARATPMPMPAAAPAVMEWLAAGEAGALDDDDEPVVDVLVGDERVEV